MLTQNLEQLEIKLDKLLTFCTKLQQENKRLHDLCQNLTAQRDELNHKNDRARAKLENMLSRLHQLEEATYE